MRDREKTWGYSYFMKRVFSFILCALMSFLLTAVAYASPLTGDNGIGAWIVLMVVAVIVLIGVIILLAKKNKEK